MMKSVKNALKRAKKEAQALPRELPAIQAENNELVAKLGLVKYQVHVYQKEEQRLLAQIENLNYEGAARQQLDAAKPKATEAKAV